MSVFFDDFDKDHQADGIETKPLWAINAKNDSDLLEWVKKDYMIKERRSQTRNRLYRELISLYKGVHYKSQDARDLRFVEERRGNKNPRIVFNQIYDLVNTRVAKLARFRPAIVVYPANQEQHADNRNAITIKSLVDSLWYEIDVDKLLYQLELATDIFGEAYLRPHWDEMAGGENQSGKRLLQKGTTEITDDHGNTITVNPMTMIGDVNYELVLPDKLWPEHQKHWSKVNHATHLEYFDLEELKADHPDKSAKLNSNGQFSYDLDSMEDEFSVKNKVLVCTLYHRPTKYLPEGMIIKFTHDTILEKKTFSSVYKFRDLPFIRQSDIDVPGELHGRSFINVIRQPQKHYNNIASGIARNHGVASTPKWVIPAGSCDISQLANDSTVVTFKGPIAPRLEVFNPTPGELFKYMGVLKDEMQQLSGVHGVSRGKPPSQISSKIGLEFLNEQEDERESTRVAKRDSVITKLATMTVSLMGQHYKDDEERFIKKIGDDGVISMAAFKGANFDSSFDIRIQKSSWLPNTKKARIDAIVSLKEAFPNQVPDEIVVDALDLAKDKKYRDMITVNVRSAESEIEKMNDSQPVSDPAEWEDHLIHYKMHLMDIQSESFKTLPPEIQQVKKDHLLTTEYLMVEKAKRNPAFAQSTIVQFPLFPIFFFPGDSAPISPNEQVAGIEQNMMASKLKRQNMDAPIPGQGLPPMQDESSQPMPLPQTDAPILGV